MALKYGVLNHLPRIRRQGAWLAVQTMAHNLARCKAGSVWESG